jgi:thiosulfate reductase cytochrome b subunit
MKPMKQRTVTARVAFLVVGAIVAYWPANSYSQTRPNPIHPSFPLRDKQGRLVSESKEVFSSEKSCGACHDVGFITHQTSHPQTRVDVDCVDCHFDGVNLKDDPSVLDEKGWLKREAIRIRAPQTGQCAKCHGIVHNSFKPLVIPAAIDKEVWKQDTYTTYSITLGTGAIISGQKLVDSYLNLQGKEQLAFPWDVHAARLVQCRDCHFAGNNPEHTSLKTKELPYLRFDPRRVGIAEYLQRPDHQLAKTDCRACHQPMVVHDFLPFKARHLRTLSCEACHISVLRGPAYQMVDATVVLPSGQPSIAYRDIKREPGQSLDTVYLKGYQPLLVPTRGRDGLKRFAPFNLVTRWVWISGTTRRQVPFDLIKKAFLDGDRYAQPVVNLFDADHNGGLEPAELRLDTAEKVRLTAERLAALGVIAPRIAGLVEPVAVAHGVLEKEQVQRDCDSCHGEPSRLVRVFAASEYVPDQATIQWKKPNSLVMAGTLSRTSDRGLRYIPAKSPLGFHIFGLSRQEASNTFGLMIFSLVTLGCFLHGSIRVIGRRRAKKKRKEVERAYVYSVYDRVWHWIMAICGIVLLVTGFKIHLGPAWSLIDMAAAVTAHNAAAIVLTANAFLTLFYHLTTNAIQKYIPGASDLLGRITKQLDYYLRGIFTGAPNPTVKTPKRRLNPLQQLTYLALFSLLLPWQIITGMLIWSAARWAGVDTFIGGLTIVAPLHNLGSWFFLSFFVLHHYLITTGATPLAELRTMVSGYDLIEKRPLEP